MSKPILSICIPTYNRAKILQDTIESIVSQEEFRSGKVEIVISDNCSEDSTRSICGEYQNKYTNFLYFRNKENIRDRNFPTVLARGTGVYRKLSNDTVKYLPGSLKFLTDLLERPEVEKNHPVIYYSGRAQGNEIEELHSLSKFLHRVSYWVTWIGGIGIWEEDADKIENSIKDCETHLWQVPFLLERIVEHNQRSLIINKELTMTKPSEHKFYTRQFYEIFYINYLKFIKRFVDSGILSMEDYEWARRDLLYSFMTDWMIGMDIEPNRWMYDIHDPKLSELVLPEYKTDSYYDEYMKYYKIRKKKKIVRHKAHLVKEKLSRIIRI